jgi:hypothetical protein
MEQIKIKGTRISGDVSTLFPNEERRAGSISGIGQTREKGTLTDTQRAAVKAGWKTLWLVGRASYKDAFGVGRFTNYRFFESGEYMTTVNKLILAEEGNEAD